MDYIKLIKDDDLHVGALYKFESELMKIIVKSPDIFHAGDVVTFDYADFRFKSKILKIQENHLYVLVPQTYKQFPNDKRQHPRIKVDLGGTLFHRIQLSGIDVKIVDLSRMGFGIVLESTNPVQSGDFCKIVVNLSGIQISANLKIRNVELFEEHCRFGCEIQSIGESDEYELRKFILSEQLKRNMIY